MGENNLRDKKEPETLHGGLALVRRWPTHYAEPSEMQSGRTPQRVSFLDCWFSTLAIVLAAGMLASAADKPILRLDLRSLGAVGLVVPDQESSRPVYAGDISFIDNSTLFISFPVFNPAVALSTREQPTGGSILLHTVVFDLTSSHVRNERSWGDVGKMDVIAAGNRLVVISGRQVQVMSHDLQPEREYRYDNPFRLRTSETGGTLFVLVQREQGELVEVLDAAGQKSPYTFRAPSDGSDAFSDSSFAFTHKKGKETEIFRASLEQLRDGVADLQALSYRAKGDCANLFFITNDLLILGGKCHELTVLGSDGAIRAQQPIGELAFSGTAETPRRFGTQNYLGGFVTSRDQNRFAFILRDARRRERKGEIPAVVSHARTLVVYDTSLTKLFETPLPHVAKATYAVDQALSPDGSLVALLVGWTVTVYRVPEPLR